MVILIEVHLACRDAAATAAAAVAGKVASVAPASLTAKQLAKQRVRARLADKQAAKRAKAGAQQAAEEEQATVSLARQGSAVHRAEQVAVESSQAMRAAPESGATAGAQTAARQEAPVTAHHLAQEVVDSDANNSRARWVTLLTTRVPASSLFNTSLLSGFCRHAQAI